MKLRFLLIGLLLQVVLFSLEIHIPVPQIENNGFVNDLPVILNDGEPQIAYVPVKILLPMGEKFKSINFVKAGKVHKIENVFIDYAKQIQPISNAFSIPEKGMSQSIYNADELFPKTNYKVLGTQRMNGFEILLINLFPYKFNPVKKELVWNDKVEIDVETEFDRNLFETQNKFLLLNNETKKLLERTILNPAVISSYQKNYFPPQRDLPDPNDPYSMIIITDENGEEYLQEFLSWKNERGVKTKIFLTSEIYSNFAGGDDAEKIKNFIINAYQAYSGTEFPLEYVLLGGDDEIIPIRGVFIDTGYGTVDHHMPCDLYYSCLDNDWDANGNRVFGEIEDDVDLIPEIAIGRIPADVQIDFDNFFHKTQSYVEETTISTDIAYLLGENLNWNPLTWGGDYKDEVAAEVPFLEENYHVYRLYQREDTYSPQAVTNAINSGLSIINHMGHSNQSIVFGQTIGSVNSYTNTEYGFAYTQGCYPAAFDEATSHQGESIAENLVNGHAGLFAFVGNTRYGWYSPGNTNGPSQPYDIEFFKALFNDNIRQLGKALAQSRIVLANQALTNTFLRWVHYELVLLGDPSVSVKDAVGSFPYIQPQNVVYNDVQGDNDGFINPGETIEIEITLENDDDWADAENVYAIIEFENDDIQVLQDSVFYGNIAEGTSVTASPFVISISPDCALGTCHYNLHIFAPVNEDISYHRSFELSFELSLFQQNWPWQSFYTLQANPIIADFNADGEKEILVTDVTGNINLLNIDAEQTEGFPWEFEENIFRSAAYGDIDGDGFEDIVLASRNNRIFALNNEGNLIFDYNCCEQFLTPLISDIDGDGNPEVVSLSSDRNLIVLNSSGNLLENFPVELSAICNSEIASANIDGIPGNEIVIGTYDGNLSVINKFGENADGFPINLESAISAAPIVLDNFNIAVGCNDGMFYLINPSAEIVFSDDFGSRIANSPIAADFDNDGTLEIAFATINGDIFVIEQDGSGFENFPVSFGETVSNPPLAVDIDNDNYLEILCFNAMNDLYIFNTDGSQIGFSPISVGLVGNIPASVEDVDEDGDFEIVSGSSNKIIVIDSKLSKGNKIPWHTYRGNYKRTGFYGDNEIFTESDENVIENISEKLFQNVPNPFMIGKTDGTVIKFMLTETAKSEISIYNIKGEKVKSFVLDGLEKGVHRVFWNGKDENQKRVGSGIYFYKFNTNNYEKTKKMLLIK